jgi:DNA-binding MarR family transcriptional regulator
LAGQSFVALATNRPGAYHAADMSSASAAPAATGSNASREVPGKHAPDDMDGFMARIDPRLQPWLAFLRAHAAVSRTLEAELEAEQSMSLADYEALMQLAHADGRRLRMSELADRMILTRSGISRLVDRLEAGGYVERVACSTDARGAYAVLTEAGYARLQAASPTHLRGIDEHFLSAIPPADRETFTRVLTGILDGLERPDRSSDEAYPD